MPGRRSRAESDVSDTASTMGRAVRAHRESESPGDERIRTVENDPNLLALPSAHFAQRAWMLARAHALTLETEWKRVKLFYIAMTDFAKMQKSLDREVDPVEITLGPWVARIRETMLVHIANNRMEEETLVQFELLHARLRSRIEEGRLQEVKDTMVALQTLFSRHAKLWLDYNACIPVPYRLKMLDLYPWAMEKWVLSPDHGFRPGVGFFLREAVPEIMDHIVTVYCESQ